MSAAHLRHAALAIAVAPGLLSAACSTPQAQPLSQQTPSLSASLSGVTLSGTHVSLSMYRGHPVVLIFWGSWCGPCHDEQPALNQQYGQWSSHGVVFLGVDMRDDGGPARTFQQQEQVRYQSVADPNATIAADFDIPAAPALVFVDGTGRVADTVLGGLGDMSTADFSAEVRSLLAS